MTRGLKTGGRLKGTANKVNREVRDSLLQSGISPLKYLVTLMRNSKADPARRDWAAAQAAPYLHARLAALEVKGDVTVSHEDRVLALTEKLKLIEAEQNIVDVTPAQLIGLPSPK